MFNSYGFKWFVITFTKEKQKKKKKDNFLWLEKYFAWCKPALPSAALRRSGIYPPQEGSSTQLLLRGTKQSMEASSEESWQPVVKASISLGNRAGKQEPPPDRFRASVPGNNKAGNKQQELVKGSDLALHLHVLESPWRWLTSLIMAADRGLFIWMSDKNTGHRALNGDLGRAE